jgi:ferric-dicitrate binding protein FerR (iron transport regulator)
MARSTLADRTRTYEPTPARVFHARRFATLATIAAAIVVLIVVGIVSSGARAALAQVRVRTGGVDVEHPGKPYVAATDGTDVAAGDQIKTALDGQAVIDYFDGSVTRMDASTHVAIRELSETRTGDRIGVALVGGRLWDHIRDATSPSDRFEVHLSNVTMSSAGSTFLTDCRRSDACYIVGFDGTTHVGSSDGEQADLNAGDCESVSPDGSLAACDANTLSLVDAWVRENLAEDQELVTPNVTPSPIPTASPAQVAGGTQGFVQRPVSRPPLRTPSKTPPPSTSTPVPTKDHNNDGQFPTPLPTPTHRPHRSP